jgi:hypothetical protein
MLISHGRFWPQRFLAQAGGNPFHFRQRVRKEFFEAAAQIIQSRLAIQTE